MLMVVMKVIILIMEKEYVLNVIRPVKTVMMVVKLDAYHVPLHQIALYKLTYSDLDVYFLIIVLKEVILILVVELMPVPLVTLSA